MDLDDLLPEIGEFGKYQKLVLWFTLLPAVFPCGFHAYNQLFMATVPDHWCRVPELDGLDHQVAKNISIPTDEKSKFSHCTMFETEFDNETVENANTPGNVRHVPCKNGWVYDIDSVDNSVVSEWDLVCGDDFAPTLALVLFGISGLVGNYIFGYTQDRLGRKTAYFIYLFIQCVFGIATAFARNFPMWLTFRIGVGFTIPAILGTPGVLAIELVGPKDRTTVTILVNIAYSLSLVTLAGIVWAIRPWRWMAVATTAPLTLLFFFWWVLPESPRWLLARGRVKEAELILNKMARVNGKKLPPHFIARASEKLTHQSSAEHRKRYGLRDLFSSTNLAIKTVIITFLWFTNTSVYVGLSYYAPALGGDEFLNFFLAAAVEFPTYLFLWPAMVRLGRRWTLCISMVVGGTSCLATFLVQDDYATTLVLYCVGKMGISSSFVVLPLMASELYPTVVRGMGMSLSSVIGMLGPIFIPLVNYMGSDMIILPLIIMGSLLVTGGLCSLLLPETINQHLPQTLADAEKTKLDFFACCNPPQLEKQCARERTNCESKL